MRELIIKVILIIYLFKYSFDMI